MSDTDNDIHLLCTGDLHLGRHPTRIPGEYDSRNYSPISIWKKIVEKAVNLKVDAVIFSGDIIDRENRFYEAFGPLESGIKKLEEQDIFTFAVAGNHDYDVLTTINRNLKSDHFHLVGIDGR